MGTVSGLTIVVRVSCISIYLGVGRGRAGWGEGVGGGGVRLNLFLSSRLPFQITMDSR